MQVCVELKIPYKGVGEIPNRDIDTLISPHTQASTFLTNGKHTLISKNINMLIYGAKKVLKQFARETQGHWVGPFPIREFLDLLPHRDDLPTSPFNVFNGLSEDDTEVNRYGQLVTYSTFRSGYMLTVP